MIEPVIESQRASDGYDLHVAVWPARGELKGRLVVIHGVQSHGGWYHNFGRTLAEAGYETHFPDRRGSGANRVDRGHTPSPRRLVDDIAERFQALREADSTTPLALAGISWGGKTAILTAAEHPGLVDALALICPGFQPRVGVSLGERLKIAWAFLTNRRETFPIPLSDPTLFTANPEGQRFIANDPLGLRAATAGLLAASTFIDRRVGRAVAKVRQPVLLMLAGQDRIVDNDRTRAFLRQMPAENFQLIEYPDGHHTLEFEPDPSRYARDLVAWLDLHAGANLGNPAGVLSKP